METKKCEFHKIKVAKARKNSSVETALSEVILYIRVALSIMEATSLPAPAE